jgi:predicted pyridoxine 5'-phosphate oxidase superfamily flavin-nucleotide-binding protein
MPQERAIKKEMSHLDKHCIDFIALSPFVVLATSDVEFNMDASPRGGVPGFVKVTNDGRLLIPEAPETTESIRFRMYSSPRKSGSCF